MFGINACPNVWNKYRKRICPGLSPLAFLLFISIMKRKAERNLFNGETTNHNQDFLINKRKVKSSETLKELSEQRDMAEFDVTI